MKLNPLIKIENIEQDKCLLSLLIDRKKLEVNKDLFMLFLDCYNNGLTRDNIELHISDTLKANIKDVSSFINKLFDKKARNTIRYILFIHLFNVYLWLYMPSL